MLCLKLTLFMWLLAVSSLHISAETVITCYGHVQHLSCVDGVINVQSATYGRKDKELCSIGRPPTELANTNCLQAVPLISQICNGRRECEINPHTFSLPDPCYGTYKYFTTTYECIPAWTSLTCEAGYSKLNCGNYVIQINTANYGRTDSTICSAGRPSGQITNTNCFAPKTFTEVSKQCNGQAQLLCACFAHYLF